MGAEGRGGQSQRAIPPRWARAFRSYAQVTFDLYAESGAKVGTAMANVAGLRPGQAWDFEALILDDSAVRYELDEVTAY